MSNRDWSLVFFTTLAQWSVGIVLWFTGNIFFNGDSVTMFETGLSLENPVLLALVFIGSATLSSFLHLGNPANALKALNNLSGSWLSREILAIGIFSLMLVIALIAGWNNETSEYLKYLLVLGSFSGLALLWMMIRIYVMPTIPAWNSWYTPLSFVSTALNLGLVTLLVFQAAGVVEIDGRVVTRLLVLLMLILFVETVSAMAHQYQLERMDTGIDTPAFDQGPFYGVFLVRITLLIITFIASFSVIFSVFLLSENQYFIWFCTILALVVAQELAGRLLFYASYFRAGV